MNEIRCSQCNKLLLKAEGIYRIEIKCHKCKKINIIECQERQTN